MAQQRASGASVAASLLLMLLAAAAVRAQAQPLQEQTAEEAEGMESLPPPLRYLLVQRLLDARLAAADPTRPLRKRTCLINAGLSHGCDYKDLMGAMEESNYWNSALSPGRRRRSVFPQAQIQQERSQEIEFPVANSNDGEIVTDRRGVVKVKKNELHKALNRIPLNAF